MATESEYPDQLHLDAVPEESFTTPSTTRSTTWVGNKDTGFLTPAPALAPHEVYLHDLFGSKWADSILHPRMNDSGGIGGFAGGMAGGKRISPIRRDRTNQSILQSIAKSSPQQPQKKKTKGGRARDAQPSAGTLWRALREDTSSRLKVQDDKMDTDLKQSYDALAREFLTNKKSLPDRSFSGDESIIQLRDMLAQTKLERLEMQRRKKRLMYELARVHKDQFAILLHNNPLPDLYDSSEGGELVKRYLPLDLQETFLRDAQPRRWHSPLPSPEPVSAATINGQRLRFLTEQDTRIVVDSSFRNRYVDTTPATNQIAIPPSQPLPPAESNRLTLTSPATHTQVETEYPRRQKETNNTGHLPLTLGTLIQCQTCLEPLSTPQWRHGAPRFWNQETAIQMKSSSSA